MKKAVGLALLTWLGGVFAFGEVPEARTIWQEKLDPPRLELEVRWNAPVTPTGLTARAGTQVLPVKFAPFGESADGRAAVLFLIDQSDPKRARTIEAVKTLVLQLIDAAGARAQCAIYAFDSALAPVADWGTARAQMPALLKPLRPTGLATELYRNVAEGAALLERRPERRRILVLLSDGKAEDTTYTLEQAGAAALKACVTVYGLGYAETPQSTVHLQSLRQLAAHTGGVFAEADIGTKKIPARFTAEFAPLLFSGGFATVDLQGVQGREVVCEWQSAALPPAVMTVPLQLTAPAPAGDKKAEEMASAVQQMKQQVAAVAQLVAAVPGKIEESAKKTEDAVREAEEKRQADEQAQAVAQARAAAQKKFLLLMLAGLALALAVAAATFIFNRRRKALLAAANAPVFARLQVLDGDGTEHRMTTTALRIGRGKDNDLTLGNDSVSRHHAEISRTRDGVFTITELNAGNGVLVNGKQVEKTELKDEDVIELGEVRLRFFIG